MEKDKKLERAIDIIIDEVFYSVEEQMLEAYMKSLSELQRKLEELKANVRKQSLS